MDDSDSRINEFGVSSALSEVTYREFWRHIKLIENDFLIDESSDATFVVRSAAISSQ